jgi:hypothetical protein
MVIAGAIIGMPADIGAIIRPADIAGEFAIC